MKFDCFAILIILTLIFHAFSFCLMLWNDESTALRRAARKIDLTESSIIWTKSKRFDTSFTYYGKERLSHPQSFAGYRVYLTDNGWVAVGGGMYENGLKSSDEGKRVCQAHDKRREEKLKKFLD